MSEFLGRAINEMMEYLAILLNFITCPLKLLELLLKLSEYRRRRIKTSQDWEGKTGSFILVLTKFFT